jgi:large subunit ribosomal protein L6
MSRIGKKPVAVPDGVKVTLSGQTVTLEGKQGTLTYVCRPEVTVAYDQAAKLLVVTRSNDERASRAYHGLTRALLANMVEGVLNGYVKALEIVGVGYTAKLQGAKLVLNLGYANPVNIDVPAGVKVEVPAATKVIVKGPDKQAVGELAAEIRSARKPEPYKGKGVRYVGEVIRRKAGKAFAGTSQ